MSSAPSSLQAPLGFTRPEDVSPDAERPGLLRAKTLPFDIDPYAASEFHPCTVNDCTALETVQPRLEQAGFETIDISGNAELQQVLAGIRDADRVSDDSAQALRGSLTGTQLSLAGDVKLRVEFVSDQGLIMRRAGPAGLDVNPDGMQGANGHGAAMRVHGDQDVFGTPLKQLMNGDAPQLFRHQTPDGRNQDASLFLLNLWIPLQQITRPLVLMDRRTLDAKHHQLRYGLPVTRFLERDEETEINDIWTFLHDPSQEWYFRSAMGPDQAWLFDTLGEPHGACILPGEEALEELYRRLDDACEAAEASDADALRTIAETEPPALPDPTTEAIRAAWQRMTSVLAETPRALGGGAEREDWTHSARAAQDAVIRRSIEMRLAATLEAPADQ